MTDEGIERVGHAGKIADSLKEAGLEVVIWNGAVQDCPKAQLRKLQDMRDNGVDGIVGVGGGSVLSTAKAIAAVAPNGDDVLDDIALYITGQRIMLIQD